MERGIRSPRRNGLPPKPIFVLPFLFVAIRRLSDGSVFCRSVENLCSCRYAGGYDLAVFRSPVFGTRDVCEGNSRKHDVDCFGNSSTEPSFSRTIREPDTPTERMPAGQRTVLPRGRRGSFPRAFVPCGFRPSNFCAGVPEPGPEAAMPRNSRIPENSGSRNSGAVRGPGLSVRPLRLRHSARFRGACRCVFVFPTKKAAREKSDGFSVKRSSGSLPIACDRITRS